MNENVEDAVQESKRKSLEKMADRPREIQRPTIHYTQLPEDTSTSPIAVEWNFYRREAGNLLAEGHERRWVLIKGEKIIGIWDTQEAAYEVALQNYLMQPVLIHQILTREPVLRGPTHIHLCRN